LRTLEAMGTQSGVYPRWPAAIGEGGSMIGSSADLLFAGGAAKNLLPDAFFAAQFDRILSSAAARREGYVEDTLTLGYVANDRHGGSVSLSVEFAYNDGMLADLAERLGRPEAAELRTRSHYWRNHLNPESGFLEPRDADGTFKPRRFEQIFHSGGPYVEGSAWHWRFSAFHEPEALAEALGGTEALHSALTEYFGRSWMLNDTYTAAIPDPHYWHGNQPSLHVLWLWHTAGDRVALVDWLRNIQRIVYRPTPTGRPGNDDGGTMSAWYLFAAVGMYPVAGSDRYWLGAPLLPRIELRTGPGRVLRIEAPGASDARRYVYGVYVDEVLHEAAWIDHAILLGAQTLRFDLRSTPPR
jgi:predicted alpha-1,2-mannosidase